MRLGFSSAILAVSFLLAPAFVSAATVECSADIAAKVTGTAACEIGSTNNDFLNPLQVNVDAAFGFMDWSFVGKDDGANGSVDEGSNSLALELTGGTLGGHWSIIDKAFDLYDDIMLVFKGGQGQIEPVTYVAYLLSATNGTYESPFGNSRNDNLADISHVSIYGRSEALAPVPLPAAGWLMIAGLGGLAAFRKRKAV